MEYAKTIEFVDDALAISPDYKETTEHLRFCCPYCIHKRGKPDKDYKLYVHKTKRIGWCFKCHTVVLEKKDSGKIIESETLDEVIKGLVNSITAKNLCKDYLERAVLHKEEKWYSLSGLERITPGTRAYDYLKSRKGFSIENVDKYNLLWDGKESIYIPNRIEYTENGEPITDYFQVRFFRGYHPSKYYHPSGKKPVLFLHRLVNQKILVLCEGVFDAMALDMGDICAVAVLGKSLSRHQAADIFSALCRAGSVKKIIIALDGDTSEVDILDIKYSLRNYIDISIYKAEFPEGLDPEEAGGWAGCIDIKLC